MLTRRHSARALLTCLAAAGTLAFSSRAQAQEPASTSAPLRVEINLPAYRLELLRGDSAIARYAVAIGSPRYQTPRGDYAIRRAIWNPWWHPPASAWAQGKQPVGPGPNNPMGRVKLHLQGLYYVHGSPDEASIGHAASHGCVRMRNADALDLATRLHVLTGSTVDTDALTASPRQTRDVALPVAVQVSILYRTVEVRGDSLWVYPDVYGRARSSIFTRAREAMGRAGARGGDLSEEALTGALNGFRGVVALPLSDILRRELPGRPVTDTHTLQRADPGGS